MIQSGKIRAQSAPVLPADHCPLLVAICGSFLKKELFHGVMIIRKLSSRVLHRRNGDLLKEKRKSEAPLEKNTFLTV